MGEKVYGHHAIEEAMKSAKQGSTLYLLRSGGEAIKRLEFEALATGRIRVKKLSREELDKLYPSVDLRGALLDLGASGNLGAKMREVSTEEFVKSLSKDDEALVLILDGIKDPQNLGAILRSADQFGVSLVIIPERRSVQANETVLKVSSGASKYIPIAVRTNLSQEIAILKENGFWVYAADMSGTSSYEEKFNKKSAIVMGSEGSGISQLVKKNSDQIISIPMMGHIDSLNVSVAAGILMYEYRRTNKAPRG